MAQQILRLGALCDLDSEELNGQLNFSVTEFAELSDGTRVTLDRRGWSQVRMRSRTTTRSSRDLSDPWRDLTLAELESTVRNVVLPDDDETAAVHDHPWEWLAQRAREAGLETSAHDLSSLDYKVEFSPSVVRRVTGGNPIE